MRQRRDDATNNLAPGATVFITEPPTVCARGEIIEISVTSGCVTYVVTMTRRSLHVMTDQALAILTGTKAAVLPMGKARG